jgi:hypothetical protein
VLLIALVLGVAAFVTWRVLYAPQVQVPDAGTPEVVDAGPEPIQGADITEGESVAREAMGGLVPESWLKDGDVIRRVVAAVNAVADGQSPRLVMGVMEPQGSFIVDEQKPPKKKKKEHSKFFISEKNDARYDKATQVITSMDAAAVGRLYARLRPYLETAYREIAPPGKTFDGAFIAAVDRLAAVPISDGPREVVPLGEGIGYAWADPKLEALKPAEKHLLRMGPKNARAVVKQLQAFRAAMAQADAGT